MLTVFISFLAIVLVFIGVVAYFHYSSSNKSESTTDEITKSLEPDYIFLFAGNTIDRDGKHFEWNYQLNKYEEKPLSGNIIVSEAVNVQNNETINTVTTTVESQITDAVTVKPTKPKRKRGRKPTKKVKK